MIFFYLKKKCFVLKILRFLCFCKTCRFQNLWRHHKYYCIMIVTLLLISFESFWNKMKFGQILTYCMTTISNMFLTECWRLETSFRLFYDFVKKTIQQDLCCIFTQKIKLLKMKNIYLLCLSYLNFLFIISFVNHTHPPSLFCLFVTIHTQHYIISPRQNINFILVITG